MRRGEIQIVQLKSCFNIRSNRRAMSNSYILFDMLPVVVLATRGLSIRRPSEPIASQVCVLEMEVITATAAQLFPEP